MAPVEEASRLAAGTVLLTTSYIVVREQFDDPVRVARCEQTAFNPWHCLPEHRPLGSMNRRAPVMRSNAWSGP